MLQKAFGEKHPNIVYKDRTGAYGIGFNDDGKIPVAMTHLANGCEGYFLLGGGLDKNEKHSDCIIRECLEEAGLRVTPKEFICKGERYSYIERIETYFHGIGYFYNMEIIDIIAEPTEPDHSLVWLSTEEAKEKLFLPHQIWAVEQAYKLYLTDESIVPVRL